MEQKIVKKPKGPEYTTWSEIDNPQWWHEKLQEKFPDPNATVYLTDNFEDGFVFEHEKERGMRKFKLVDAIYYADTHGGFISHKKGIDLSR